MARTRPQLPARLRQRPLLPGLLAGRRVGRRHATEGQRRGPTGRRDRLERAGGRRLGLQHNLRRDRAGRRKPRPGARSAAAKNALSPTSPPSPTPTRASRSTTRRATAKPEYPNESGRTEVAALVHDRRHEPLHAADRGGLRARRRQQRGANTPRATSTKTPARTRAAAQHHARLERRLQLRADRRRRPRWLRRDVRGAGLPRPRDLHRRLRLQRPDGRRHAERPCRAAPGRRADSARPIISGRVMVRHVSLTAGAARALRRGALALALVLGPCLGRGPGSRASLQVVRRGRRTRWVAVGPTAHDADAQRRQHRHGCAPAGCAGTTASSSRRCTARRARTRSTPASRTAPRPAPRAARGRRRSGCPHPAPA